MSIKVSPYGSGKPKNFDAEQQLNKEWVDAWNLLDVNSSGSISHKELEDKLLNTATGDQLPDEAITELLYEADNNRDGYISRQEYLTLMQNTRKGSRVRRLVRQAAFLAIPRNERDVKTRRYIDHFNCLPPPIFIISVTIAEIVVFATETAKLNQTVGVSGPVDFESPLIYNPFKRCEAWRFISNMFIHSGYLHLIYNVIIQLFLGVILELVHKWWRVMIVYVLGVFGGCLAASITKPDFYLAGASGGVYALEFAHVGNLILNWSQMRFAWLQALVLGLLIVLDGGFAIHDTYFDDDPSHTSHMAHVGGAITGVLIGVNVLKNLKKKRWEKIFLWVSLVLISLLFLAAILVHILANDYFPIQNPVCRGG